MAKNEAFSLRLDPELKKAIEQAARDEDRSINYWIQRACKRELEALKKQGKKPRP